jgi:hypothetical protein
MILLINVLNVEVCDPDLSGQAATGDDKRLPKPVK